MSGACWQVEAVRRLARGIQAGSADLCNFVVLLLLPTTSFIDIPGAQRQLCASTLETQAAGPFGSAMLSVAGLGGAGVCEQPPDQWGSYLLAQAEADGRILNESTGTCAYAESAMLNATSAEQEQSIAQAGLCPEATGTAYDYQCNAVAAKTGFWIPWM